MTSTFTTGEGTLAYTDYGGDGPLLVLLPGAGDLRSEHRFLAERLLASGSRVVTMDLRGHGDTSPDWPSYGVAETARDIAALIRHLGGGRATLIANSFAPAAGLWLADEHPELVAGVVALSAHLDEDGGRAIRLALEVMLRGPWAGKAWTTLYRRWYKGNPPTDLDQELGRLHSMMGDPARRRAVRATLTAHRNGLAERLEKISVPVLAVFGDADDHFADPAVAAAAVATRTGGEFAMVAGAGHYPHVEQPDLVADLVTDFLARV